ncbi:MAG: methyltransferase domain-containing protein [Candidatus Pacebacteria bacterium]|nr:methyltransferase domain-containing protein [Candidatus Paceibacterota bacterium]
MEPKARSKGVDKGEDNYGNDYSSLEDMWKMELGADGKTVKEDRKVVGSKDEWYKRGNEYWNNVPRDASGMLQGWTQVCEPDIKCSFAFLSKLIKEGKLKPGKALDCGGGVGRVSKELLTKFFDIVDIVDQAPNLIEKAKTSIGSPRMRNFFVSGLQDFAFAEKYDCIWIQWVLMNLTDDDMVKFLARCKESLAPGGLICAKENEKAVGFIVDKEDYSITRSKAMHMKIFEAAGLKIVDSVEQPEFPPELIPVMLYALQ